VLEGKKTNEGLLISSFACSPETADIEFRFTLSQCMQKGNNLAFHVVQSFKPGETDQNTAHQIGKELALETLKGKYEYVLSTHVDKGHIHNHLIFCAANFIDFHKYVSNKKSYYQIRKTSDRLCEQYRLSVIVPGEEKGKCYKEYIAAKTGTSWKDQMRKAAFQAIKHSSTFEEFTLRMNLSGYEVRLGDKLAFRLIGQKQFILSKTLGYRYTSNRINQKLTSHSLKHDGVSSLPALRNLVELESSKKAQKSLYYTRFLNVQNLKIAARTLNLLLDQGIHSFAELEAKHQKIKADFESTKEELKTIEIKIEELTSIEKHLRVIDKLKKPPAIPIDITNNTLLQASINNLANHGISEPFPDISGFDPMLSELNHDKDELYRRYNLVKKDLSEIVIIQRNVNLIIRPSRIDRLSKDNFLSKN